MLSPVLVLFSVFLIDTTNGDVALNTYLPPFAGYPPSRPNQPVNLYPPPSPPPPFADPEEDLESIVIEAPSFGRTFKPINAGLPSTTVSNGFTQQFVTTGPLPVAQFRETYGAPPQQVFNADQNSYVRTNQQTAFNTLPPSTQYGTPTVPLQRFNGNVRYNLLNTKASDTFTGTSISVHQSTPATIKDNYQYQNVNNYAFNAVRSNANNAPTYSTYSNQINNQYLPPSRQTVQQNSEGYVYNRPSIPFNF